MRFEEITMAGRGAIRARCCFLFSGRDPQLYQMGCSTTATDQLVKRADAGIMVGTCGNRKSQATEGRHMLFKNAKVDGLNIFYREAGNESAPKLVLLHGFPASSHQYRNLTPALADRFHVIAPD